MADVQQYRITYERTDRYGKWHYLEEEVTCGPFEESAAAYFQNLLNKRRDGPGSGGYYRYQLIRVHLIVQPEISRVIFEA
jgi:hypothetical protein